jgi:hypothetical protein
VVPKGKFAERKLIWVTKLFSVSLIFGGVAMLSGAVDWLYDPLSEFLTVIIFGFILIGFGTWLIWRLIEVSRVLPKSQIVNHKS